MMILVLAERSKVDTLQERKTPKALKIQALGRVQPLLPRLTEVGSWRDSAQNKIAQNQPFGVTEPCQKTP